VLIHKCRSEQETDAHLSVKLGTKVDDHARLITNLIVDCESALDPFLDLLRCNTLGVDRMLKTVGCVGHPLRRGFHLVWVC